MLRLSVASVAAAGLLLVSLGGAPASASASAAPSVNVAVIPGFQAPRYSGFEGVPPFPTGASALAAYQFSALAPTSVTAASLQGFDTVVLYGVRWVDLPSSAQRAIDAFALTGKVVIWDADATGSQSYATFAQPFSTTASGEVKAASQGSAITFPAGADPLASPDPASPRYLDPSALTASNHLIEDMSVMNPGAANWVPGLIAANQVIPNGGWVLAWAYGSTTDETGMLIYSGMDADAFTDAVNPNYALTELAIELASPFDRAPAASCAPGCVPPAVTGGNGPPTGATGSTGAAGSTSSGLGSAGSTTFSACSFARRPPHAWVHRRVSLFVKTSVAAGVRGELLTRSGAVVAASSVITHGVLALRVNTRTLRSNHTDALRAVVFVNSARACAISTRLRVDNTPPKLALVRLRRGAARAVLTVRASEAVTLHVLAGGATVLRTVRMPGARTVTLTVPSSPRATAVAIVDRAGNRTVEPLR